MSSGLSREVLWRAGNEAWFQAHAGEGDTLFFEKARFEHIRMFPASVLAYFSRPTTEEIRSAIKAQPTLREALARRNRRDEESMSRGIDA